MSGAQPSAYAPVALPPDAPLARLLAPANAVTAICSTEKPVTLVGSRRDCDLPVQSGDVSQAHCAVINTGRALLVTDLCSRAGTFINDRRVTVSPLRRGDRLRVGSVPVDVEYLAEPKSAEPASPPGSLKIGGEHEFDAAALPIVIGRRQGCHVVRDTPDVSLAHCLVFLLGDHLAVADLGSRSGTLVNGRREALAWLASGDVIEVGGEKLKVEWSGASPPDRAAAREAAALEGARVEAGASSATVGGLAGGAADLVTLESLLANVQMQLGAMRVETQTKSRELSERQAALERREADVQQREQELRALQNAYARQQSELLGAQNALDEERQACERQRAEIAARERAARAAEDGAAQRLAELDARHAALEAQQKDLQARQSAVAAADEQARRRSERLDRFQRGVRDRLRRVRQQRAALAQQLLGLQAREAELAARAATVEASLEQITRFQKLLTEANQFLAHAPALSSDPAPCHPQPSKPGAATPARELSGGAKAGANGKHAAARQNGSLAEGEGAPGDLPAPVIDKPIFAPPGRRARSNPFTTRSPRPS